MSVFVMKACGGGADVPLQPPLPPGYTVALFLKLSDFMSQHHGVVRFTVVNINAGQALVYIILTAAYKNIARLTCVCVP